MCFAFVAVSPSRDEDVHAYARVALECRERRYTAATRRACGQSLNFHAHRKHTHALANAHACAACLLNVLHPRAQEQDNEAPIPLKGQGDMVEQSIEGRGAEGVGREAPAEKRGAMESPELAMPAGRTRGQIRSKKAFQLAWKEKFKGKGIEVRNLSVWDSIWTSLKSRPLYALQASFVRGTQKKKPHE